MIKLTTKEILDLAEFAGLSVKHKLNEEELDCEYYLCTGVDNSIKVYSEDGESFDFYRTVVTCNGCEYNEVQPLGEPIDG